MAAPGVHDRPPIAETQALVKRWADWFHHADDVELGKALIGIREAGIDSLEAVFAEGLRRFDKSGEYAADGALSIVPWLRWKCNLSGGAATERVAISRQLEHLPETRKAFAVGALGYQHVAGMARTAEHLGVTAVRKAESTLLQTAATMDPGRFTGVLKNFEHQVDAAGALAEANRAYERRYLRIGQPADGLVRLDGLLDAEGGSTLIAALDALMPPPGKHDQRTAGQRRADALIDLCVKKAAGSRDGAGPRPHLVLRASVETLAGTPGAAAGQFEWGGSVPAGTVQRLACDAALTLITGKGELEAEISRATRSVPPSTRRALAARDHGCVAEGCGRPPQWTDAHHVRHWADGGETTMPNLVLLCR
ncbi:MAG TPA: hypothetical protein DCR15_15340, partial [Arthrobacter bacterium]|nr:hypothetical protein [Arthrobacter sp.]